MKTVVTTYSYRIKDSTSGKHLIRISRAVNLVWNYCNETSHRAIRERKQFLSNADLDKLTAGSSKLLPLHSQTIQAITKEYVTRRRQHKKAKLRWRSNRRSPGWIPFKRSGVKLHGDSVTYQGHAFKFWNSRAFPEGAQLKTGSFSQDARGRWYVHFQIEVRKTQMPGNSEEGLDFGLKDQVNGSSGQKYSRENLTKAYEEKLASAQRANKTKQVKNIHAKIANKRKDWAHKVSTELVCRCLAIAVGLLNIRGLMKTKMAKSVADAGWGLLGRMLVHKAIAHGVLLVQVHEAYTTRSCHVCGELTGPKGVAELGVRTWICSNCGTRHDRDQNAAINIFVKAFEYLPRSVIFDEAGYGVLFGLDGADAASSALGQESSDSGTREKKVGTAKARRSGLRTPN